MNKEQEGAIDKNLETLVNAFHHNLDCFVSDLRIAKVINADQRDKFRKYDTTREKLIDLFDLLRTTDSGWNLILVHLTHSNQLSLAETLKAAAGETVNIHTPSEDDIWNNENFYNNHQQLADSMTFDGNLVLTFNRLFSPALKKSGQPTEI